MRRIILPVLVALLGGCDFALVKPPAEPTLRYVLQIKASSEESPLAAHVFPGLLYVPDSNASPQINSSKILFEKTDGVIDSYKFALWSEPTTTRLPTIFARAIEQGGLFKIVSRRNGPAPADYILDSEVIDFYHDATSSPGVFNVSVSFTLTDMRSRTVLSKKTITRSVPLDSFNAAGAVKAASEAVRQVTEELVEIGRELRAKS